MARLPVWPVFLYGPSSTALRLTCVICQSERSRRRAAEHGQQNTGSRTRAAEHGQQNTGGPRRAVEDEL